MKLCRCPCNVRSRLTRAALLHSEIKNVQEIVEASLLLFAQLSAGKSLLHFDRFVLNWTAITSTFSKTFISANFPAKAGPKKATGPDTQTQKLYWWQDNIACVRFNAVIHQKINTDAFDTNRDVLVRWSVCRQKMMNWDQQFNVISMYVRAHTHTRSTFYFQLLQLHLDHASIY